MSLDFAVGPAFIEESTVTTTTTTDNMDMLLPRVYIPETINELPEPVTPSK